VHYPSYTDCSCSRSYIYYYNYYLQIKSFNISDTSVIFQEKNYTTLSSYAHSFILFIYINNGYLLDEQSLSNYNQIMVSHWDSIHNQRIEQNVLHRNDGLKCWK